MAPRQKLSLELATSVKKMIWDGAKNAEVAAAFGISVATVNNMKNGTQYFEAPWPDSTTGPMSAHASLKVANNRRFETKNRRFYDKWDTSPERFYQHISDRVFADQLAREQGFESYGAMGAFREKEAYEKQRLRDEEEMRRIKARNARYQETREAWLRGDITDAEFEEQTGQKLRREIIDQDGPIDPAQQDIMEWDAVLELAPSVTIVQVAESTDDADLKLAIGLVFQQVASSNWNEGFLLTQIMNIKRRIAAFHAAASPQV